MMNKSTKGEKFLDFLAGKGFYMVLGLCVVAIAVSGYFLLFGGEESPGGEELAMEHTVAPTPTPGPTVIPPPTAKPTATPAPQASDKPAAELPTEQPEAVDVLNPAPSATLKPPAPSEGAAPKEEKPRATPTPTPAPVIYMMPIQGALLQVHSPDELVYSKTMGDWRVHMGLDIAAAPDTVVCAAAAGKVVDIREDVRLGTCVVIRHNDGLETLYANLDSTVMVIIDQSIAQGDPVGLIGQTADFEAGEESHLHFEILQDGISLNPEDFFAAL